MTVASLETEFQIEFLSTNIIQTGLTILVKNLVLQTIERFNKMSRKHPRHLSFSILWILSAIRQKKGSTQIARGFFPV